MINIVFILYLINQVVSLEGFYICFAVQNESWPNSIQRLTFIHKTKLSTNDLLRNIYRWNIFRDKIYVYYSMGIYQFLTDYFVIQINKDTLLVSFIIHPYILQFKYMPNFKWNIENNVYAELISFFPPKLYFVEIYSNQTIFKHVKDIVLYKHHIYSIFLDS